MAHATRIQSGRAEPEHLATLEDDDVATSALGQMIGRAHAHDAATDDYHIG